MMGVGNPGEGLLFFVIMAVFLLFALLGTCIASIILLFGGSHAVAVSFIIAGVVLGIGFACWLSWSARG